LKNLQRDFFSFFFSSVGWFDCDIVDLFKIL